VYFRKFRKKFITLSAIFLLVIYTSSIYAATIKDMDVLLDLPLEELMNIKIEVASGIKQSRAQAPSVTSVITAQDIEAMGAETLSEVLASVPGLHARITQGRDNTPSYSIRGIGSGPGPEILMLINGVPMNTLEAGYREAWSGLSVHFINRIEIIRGTGSAMYGADAFSGVINIITKTKDDIDGTEAGVRAGSFDSKHAWLLHGGTWAGFDLSTQISYRDTGGYKKTVQEDAQTPMDRAFNTHASLAPGSTNMAREELDMHVDLARDNWRGRMLYQTHDFGTGLGIGSTLDPEGSWLQKLFLTDLTYHNPSVGENWDVTATLSHYRQSWESGKMQRVFPRGAFGGAYPDGMLFDLGEAEASTRLDASGIYSGFADHLLRIGTGYYTGKVYEVTTRQNFGVGPDGNPLDPTAPPVVLDDTPHTFLPEGGTRRMHYLSLQDTWRFASQWELTTGVRYDDYSDFGSTINPRAALVWNTSPALTSKLMYGQAFRAPSYDEQHTQNNPIHTGNPNLKPELIKNLELAFDYRASEALNLDLNFFNYDIKDKILFASNPEQTGADGTVGGLSAQNLGEQKGYGLEFETRWNINSDASLLFNYSYTKPTDQNLHIDVPKIPQQMAYVRADWYLLPDWTLDTQAKWVGERPREVADTRTPLKGYTTVNLALHYKDLHKDGWNLGLGVRNLFDSDARDPSQGPDANGVIALPGDLPLAGRSVWAEARYAFK